MAGESRRRSNKRERVDHQLVRGIGVPALTANIVSSTIGAGIFVLPAAMSRTTRAGGASCICLLRDWPWCCLSPASRSPVAGCR